MSRKSGRLVQVLLGLMLSFWAFSAVAECDAYASRIKQAGTDIKRITLTADAQSVDDTEAIECAFEAAATAGFGTVQLLAGDFYLSELKLQSFRGSFDGQSKANTRLHIIDQSVDCAAQAALYLAPAAIRFQGGTPVLRNISITSGKPCMDGTEMSALVMFTRAESFTCEAGLIFGSVDRVSLTGGSHGLGEGGVHYAILAAPEGVVTGSCQNRLNGTFKVNRSEIEGYIWGIYTSMHAGAQVDVNFNTFTDLQTGFEMHNSNQLTHIYINTFNTEAGEFTGYRGVAVSAFGYEVPATTAITVLNNTFNIAGDGARALQTSAISINSTPELKVVFSGNTVELDGLNATGVQLQNANNAVVINNVFKGPAFAGVWVGAGSPVSDVAVLANNFSGLQPSWADVLVQQGERTVIGPGQMADVTDTGTDTIITDNNLVLPP